MRLLQALAVVARGPGADSPSTFERIFNEAKVAFVGGHEHGKGFDNFVRINFATSQEIIAEAINRIVKIL